MTKGFVPTSPDLIRILHLEDSVPDHRLVCARLRAEQFPCEVERVETEAQFRAALLAGCPDVILADYRLPGFDGRAALEIAHKLCPSVPFIVLSGAIGEAGAVEILKAGATDCLMKDRHERLVPAILRALEETQERRARQAAEQALRISESHLADFFENATIGLHWVGPDGIILRANKAELNMLGYSREEYVGRHITEFHVDRHVIDDIFSRLLNGEIVHEQEARLRAKDGTIKHVAIASSVLCDAQGDFVHTRCFTRDITKKKAALEEAHARMEQLKLIADTAPVLIAHCDAAHRYKFVNELYAARFGLRRDQVIGRHISEILGETAYAGLRPYVERVLAGETVEFEISLPYEKLGAHFMRCAYAPERDGEGRVVGLVAAIIDITERKRSEEALRAAKEAAEEASHSKDRFLAALSHELRTPLTPVLMTLGALEQEPGLRPEVREDLAMIKRNIELETKLIDDLLDVSRITTGKVTLRLAPVDLNELVGHVCGICRPQLDEREVRLDLSPAGERLVVTADAARLQQVLWNVLKNAVKFSLPHGAVRVSTAVLVAGRCEVRVRDAGIGIAPEVLPKIFDAFEQGDPGITREFGGLGLGLAISKALVELQGGCIRAESAGPGQGATFVIELPLHSGATGVGRPEGAAPAPRARPAPLRLLVVEDHANTARALRMLLTQAGYTVGLATSVATALDLARRETFDLLLTDIGLPDGTGYDVMARLKTIQPLRGIVMSGYGMEEDLKRSTAAGFVEHVVKPFEGPELLAAIARVGAAGRQVAAAPRPI
ncbi:MAG: PAS domain S-box protein [Opitutaceae bacterium]|nr:PAS domain S-box protein [Opitutaceae bacterium]